jgi:DNA-binding NarL/FixJ family response regulator
VLVDDDDGFLQAAHTFLDSQRVRIVGEARTSHEAIALVEPLRPDLVLLDLDLAGRSSLPIVRLIKAHVPPPWVIIVSLHDQEEYLASAREAGADGFVTKSYLATELMPMIDALLQGAEPPNPTAGK